VAADRSPHTHYCSSVVNESVMPSMPPSASVPLSVALPRAPQVPRVPRAAGPGPGSGPAAAVAATTLGAWALPQARLDARASARAGNEIQMTFPERHPYLQASRASVRRMLPRVRRVGFDPMVQRRMHR